MDPCLPALKAGSYPPSTGYDADIIILTRNRFSDTIEAVDSALAQQNLRFHVSVLDQNSDEGVQMQFCEAFRNHPNFGYFRVAENLGVAGGRNFLSSLGNGRIIIGLDNDAIFADAMVAANTVRRFEETPALGILGFKVLSEDGVHLDLFSWGYPAGLTPQAGERFDATTFVGAGHAIRRSTWIAAGGYDAALFFTWEEYDFALRAIALNWLVQYDGSLAVIHKIAREARVQWSGERTRLFIRNRLTLGRKWHATWLKLSPRICIYLLKAARNRRLMPALGGLYAAIAQDGALLKRAMNAHAISYVRRNETRFHENPLAYFCRRILVKDRPDMEDVNTAKLQRPDGRPENPLPPRIVPGTDTSTKPRAGLSPF